MAESEECRDITDKADNHATLPAAPPTGVADNHTALPTAPPPGADKNHTEHTAPPADCGDKNHTEPILVSPGDNNKNQEAMAAPPVNTDKNQTLTEEKNDCEISTKSNIDDTKDCETDIGNNICDTNKNSDIMTPSSPDNANHSNANLHMESANDSAIASDLSQISELTEHQGNSHVSEFTRQDSGVNLSIDGAQGDIKEIAGDKICDIVTDKKDDCDKDLMPTSIDTEDSEPVGEYDVITDDRIGIDDSSTDEAPVREEPASGDSDNSDIDMEEVEGAAIGRDRPGLRNRRRRRISSSSESSEGDRQSTNRHSDQSDESEPDQPIDYEMPPDTWHFYHEVIRREFGYSNHSYGNLHYCMKATGSVELARRLKLKTRLESHSGCVNALHFNSEGKLLASGSDDLEIVIWDWANHKVAMKFDSGHRANVFQCKFMPYSGSCTMVSCARDGQVRMAELSTTGRCKGTKKLAYHKGSAHKLALLEDSPHVFLSCGEDAVTYEIDLRQEKPNKLCLLKENGKKIPLYSIHANPHNSNEYITGGRDHFIRVYDRRKAAQGEDDAMEPVKKFTPHHLLNSDIRANVTCAIYNYDGTEILGTFNDEDIYLFDASHSDGADLLHRYSGHRNNATVKGVNFYGPQSEFIVSGSDCSNLFLWEKKSEKIVNYFHADDGGVVNVLEPHPNMPILATSGLDNDVKIWSPTAEHPNKMEGLMKLMKKNKRERESERAPDNDMIDSQVLWMLLYHSRRQHRRQAREEGHELSDSSDSSPEDSDSDEGPPGQVPQCLQS